MNSFLGHILIGTVKRTSRPTLSGATVGDPRAGPLGLGTGGGDPPGLEVPDPELRFTGVGGGGEGAEGGETRGEMYRMSWGRGGGAGDGQLEVTSPNPYPES